MRKLINAGALLCGVFLPFLLGGCRAYYSSFYADPVKCFEQAKAHKPYDVIIVPGYPYDPQMTDGILEERIRWAYYLFQHGYTKNIIFSGSAVHSPYVEAEVMRLLALQVGLPESHLFVETKAEHTTENLYYSSVLAKKLGFQTVAFATQSAQASFMKSFDRKWDLKVDMLPIVDSCIYPSKVSFHMIDTVSAKVPHFVSLEEREGFIARLRGTRGHRVKVERREAKRH